MIHFEWDEAKDRKNVLKHGINFDTAKFVFYDPMALIIWDREIEGEQRWHILGRIENRRVLLVVHTIRNDDEDTFVRIISARKATPSERRRYEEGG
jgi:uncharacterized DUF497 family protein